MTKHKTKNDKFTMVRVNAIPFFQEQVCTTLIAMYSGLQPRQWADIVKSESAREAMLRIESNKLADGDCIDISILGCAIIAAIQPLLSKNPEDFVKLVKHLLEHMGDFSDAMDGTAEPLPEGPTRKG